MGFWKNVEAEIEFKTWSRKDLSAKSGVPMTTINRAIERDSKPYAEDALRISKALNVNLEYLLDFVHSEQIFNEEKQDQIRLYKKYSKLISFLETSSKQNLDYVKKLLETI